MTESVNPRIVMYTQALCGYCAAARSLLESKDVTYEEIDVTLDAGLRREMAEWSGVSTVPQIFIDDRHIGGYDQLSKLDREGKLDALLANSG